MVGIVGEALKSVRREKSLTIQVHPSCVDLIHNRVGVAAIQVEQQDAGDLGGTECGCAAGRLRCRERRRVIDARLETQLRCLEQVLLQTAKKMSAGNIIDFGKYLDRLETASRWNKGAGSHRPGGESHGAGGMGGRGVVPDS